MSTNFNVFIEPRLSLSYHGPQPSLWVFSTNAHVIDQVRKLLKLLSYDLGLGFVEIPRYQEDIVDHPVCTHIPNHLKERMYQRPSRCSKGREYGKVYAKSFMYNGTFQQTEVAQAMQEILERVDAPGLVIEDRSGKNFKLLFATDLSGDRFPGQLTETEVAILEVGDSISDMVEDIGKLHTDYLVSLINGINIGLKTLFGIKTPYRLWYSEKQAKHGVCWGKLASGKLVLYTEATSLETRKYPSNFDDAEYQGIGDYVKKAIPRSHFAK